jgi:hypothetical protein
MPYSIEKLSNSELAIAHQELVCRFGDITGDVAESCSGEESSRPLSKIL